MLAPEHLHALSLLLDESEDGTPIRALEIADWPRSGLPWIAFWLKELILWGTLDPVAAFLLARGTVVDRPQAEAEALAYYAELPKDITANDYLDPRRIRDWVEAKRIRPERPARVRAMQVNADLVRERAAYQRERLEVFPLDIDDQINWIDPAGYVVARSPRPAAWLDAPGDFDFELDIANGVVNCESYLRFL